MTYDRKITITTAGNKRSTSWLPQSLLWSELVARVATPVRSPETLAQFLALPKVEQERLKDVGGFVAGALTGERRKGNAVATREIVTLDLDSIPAQGTAAALGAVDGLGCTYAVYSTRKHSPLNPRLRVLLALNRAVTADEYEPIARRTAEYVGISMCDPTTFEANRLMYWGSISADSEYVYRWADRPFLDADAMLATYADWHDVRQWPVVPGMAEARQRSVDRQADPTAKPGTVGAFCRVYNIHGAIARYLPNTYTPVDGDRYTFTGGSTVGGAVVYDNGNFLFSHHATDPCGGELVNAFDLCRLHLFGDRDDTAKPDTPSNRLPSYVAMCERARQDADVMALLNKEQYAKVMEEFGGTPEPAGGNAPVDDGAWLQKLERSSETGKITNTLDNAAVILEYDPLLRGRIVFEEFSNRVLAIGPLPWNKAEGRREWSSEWDDPKLFRYMEKIYRITGEKRVLNAMAIVSDRNRINEVTDYFNGLVWDGVPRVETLLPVYLGAQDTPYVRAVTRKTLVAAVARAFTPGCKFDTMLVLTGPQGLGKSTLFRRLGRNWFNDSIQTFEGKEFCEQIQGTLIAEIAEMQAYNQSKLNLVKQVLSQVDDIFRPAYGRKAERYPRRCIFVGTHNKSDFLTDTTGNRRFLPVDVAQQPPQKDPLHDLTDDEVGQIWAEAVLMWRVGEPLYLSKEMEAEARARQEEHREVSAKEGLIADFLEKPVPVDWSKWDFDKRAMFWSGSVQGNTELVPRDRVCALEVWCELFGGNKKDMKYREAAEINACIDRLPGWENPKKPMRFGCYGLQKGRIKGVTS